MLTKSRLKLLTSLHNKKFRQQEKLVLVEGKRLLDQIHRNGISIKDLFCLKEDEHKFSYLQSKHVTTCQDWQLQKLSQTKSPQNIFGLIPAIQHPIDNSNFLLYLDGISEPGNLGTIFRTALAFGIDGIITSPDCCELLNPKSIRSSMGAIFTCPSEERDITWLINQKSHIVATSLHNSTDINDIQPLQTPLILVIGSEAHGINDKIIAAADQKIKIPISPKMESLNVAIATAITIYHLISHGLIKR